MFKVNYITSIFVAFLIIFDAKSQNINYEWLSNGGGLYSATDNNENIYICGHFINQQIFGTNNVNSNGYHFFVAKYNSNGTLEWIKKASGPTNTYAHCIDIDTQNNVYIGVVIDQNNFPNQHINFDNQIITTSTETKLGYIIKLDSNGNYLNDWNFGCTIRNFKIDDDFNFYVYTYYNQISNFANLPGSGECIAKINQTNGNINWATRIDADSDCSNFEIDNLGNIYIAGNFLNNISFGNNLNLNGNNENGFIAKIDDSGSWEWAKLIENITPQGQSSHFCLTSIEFNENNGISIVGDYNGQFLFDDTELNSTNHGYMYISNINEYGDFEYTKSIKGLGRIYEVKSNTNYYGICGYFFGDSCFLGNLEINKEPSIGNDYETGFIAFINGNGNFEYANSIGSHNNSLSWIFENDWTLTGYYKDSIAINGTSIFCPDGNSYIAKLKFIGLNEIEKHNELTDFIMFPNPIVDYKFTISNINSEKLNSIKLFNIYGKIEHQFSFSGTDSEVINLDIPETILNGVYILQVQSQNKQVYNYKVIVQGIDRN